MLFGFGGKFVQYCISQGRIDIIAKWDKKKGLNKNLYSKEKFL
jgi:hypothetical protein